MPQRRELEERIRFALFQLSKRNGHHEFEHICRRIARQRICSNILPATGPVASGGDQGRDFETFRTHLSKHLVGTSSFVGAVDSTSFSPISFACTLQETSLASKIRDDLAAIVAGGPCAAVHYFASVDLPVAKRHSLQEYARSAHSINLEIYDGAAISELLADQDLFWIAHEYLAIPADAYPQPSELPDWYRDLRLIWLSPTKPLGTFAAFQDVKRAVRSLLAHADRHADINVWLAALSHFKNGAVLRLALHAQYEMAVASFRTKSTMVEHDDDVRAFLDHGVASRDPAILMDTACLLMYATAAHEMSGTNIPSSELVARRLALEVQLTRLLSQVKEAPQRCAFLDIIAFWCIIPDLEHRRKPSVNRMFGYWKELVALAPQAPLFPMEELSARLSKCAPILVDHPNYEQLTLDVDRVVAKRSGGHAAARSCVNRSEELSAQGRVVLSIRELNRAKMEWFTAETFGLALDTLQMVALHYSELGLLYAAKYYAMAAASMALNSSDSSVKRIAPEALLLVADCDYQAGSWLSCLVFLRQAQILFANVSTAPLDTDEARDVLMRSAMILAVSGSSTPPIASRALEIVEDWPDLELLKEWGEDATTAFASFVDEWESGVESTFFRKPFADCEPEQAFAWEALGIRWNFTWTNGLIATTAAEQLMAAAQVMMCDLARADIYCLPSSVAVSVVVDSAASTVTATRTPSNSASIWTIVVPCEFGEDRWVGDLAALLTIVDELSLRPSEWPVMEALERTGFRSNVMVGDLYANLMAAIRSEPAEPISAPEPRFGNVRFRSSTHNDLEWNTSLVDEYDAAAVPEMMRRRYAIGSRGVRCTLPRLLADERTAALLRQLQEEGWLDWHILAAIGMIAASWRAGLSDESVEEARRVLQRYMTEGEKSDWAEVPLSEFTHERFETQFGFNILSTLNGLGLSSRQEAPNIGAMREFVRRKLRYFDDDIPHADPFAPP